MNTLKTYFFCLCCCLLGSSFSTNLLANVDDCIEDDLTCEEVLVVSNRMNDSLALVALYNSTDGANWTNTWDLNQPMDTWFGVTLDGSGRVRCLDLDGNPSCTLSNFTYSGNNLVGSIPTELGQLTAITHLFLSNNKINGTIPPELGQLLSLTSLNLFNNELSGSIPSELGQLLNLTSLHLYRNELSGSIPSGLGQLLNLTSLNLYSNELSGSIPPELGQLANLDRLIIVYNQLSGSIPPELGQLSSLTQLSLDNNQLSGNIPPELGQLFSLTELSIRHNQLSGSIPSELGQLSNLTHLSFWGNELSGAIPIELGQLSNLEHLNLAGNEFSGNIPPELGQLSNLKYLDLAGNEFSGSIPPELGQLDNLGTLWLAANELSGCIPVELGQLTNLVLLYLHNNQLVGNIPVELGQLTNLVQFYLYNNQLSGCFPSELTSLCNISYKFDENPNLPGGGDFTAFCDNGTGECNISDVWPGDINADGCVNRDDLIMLGVKHGKHGYKRYDVPSQEWMEYCMPDWEDYTPDGIDAKHADCDGDGIVDRDVDIHVINRNYGLTNQKYHVYPGDVNKDGVVNNHDIITHYTGVAYITGPIRPSATTDWNGQSAPNWGDANNDGIDDKHADCDGDGTIDPQVDAQVIQLNYGKIYNINPLCIYPGDVNADGIVNDQDILVLNQKHGKRGFARNGATNWEGQPATCWGDITPDDIDAKHADANGDGLVDISTDSPIISLHYGKKHGNSINSFLDNFNGDATVNSQWDNPATSGNANFTSSNNNIQLSIGLEQLVGNQSDFYGIGFTLDYSAVSTSTSLSIANSAMGQENQDLFAFSQDIEEGQMDIVVVRTDGNNISTSGSNDPFCQLIFQLDGASNEEELHLKFQNIKIIDALGNETTPMLGASTTVAFGAANNGTSGSQVARSNILLQMLVNATFATDCDNGAIGTATPYGGTAPFTYQWDNGSTTAQTTNLSVGMHRVTITDANQQSLVGNIEVFGACSALPLDLLSFRASPQQTAIQLDWLTANEVGITSFHVQRSTNGIDFSTIQTLNAKGKNSATTTYQIIDKEVVSNQTYYYRIKTNEAAKSHFSPIRTARLTDAFKEIVALPNPVKEELTLYLDEANQEGVQVIIYNQMGQQIEVVEYSPSKTLSIDWSTYPKGLYVVTVAQGEQQQVLKIIKE